MTMLLEAGTLIDGKGNVSRNRDILIEESKIKQIGVDLSTKTGSGVKRWDLSNLTALPGLVDCHVHITKGEVKDEAKYWAGTELRTEQEAGFFEAVPKAIRGALQGSYNAKCTLQAGYTTIRDMGIASDYGDIALREAIR